MIWWRILHPHFSQLLVLLPCVLIMSHACTGQGPKDSKRSKVMYVLQKVDVLDKLDMKSANAAVTCHCSENYMTISFIRKSGESVRGSSWGQCSTERENFLSHWDPFLEKTEAALCMWLEDEAQKGLSVSGDIIREKAMQLCRGCAASMSVNSNLRIFKSRWGLHTMKWRGGSASAAVRSAVSTLSIWT